MIIARILRDKVNKMDSNYMSLLKVSQLSKNHSLPKQTTPFNRCKAAMSGAMITCASDYIFPRNINNKTWAIFYFLTLPKPRGHSSSPLIFSHCTRAFIGFHSLFLSVRSLGGGSVKNINLAFVCRTISRVRPRCYNNQSA